MSELLSFFSHRYMEVLYHITNTELPLNPSDSFQLTMERPHPTLTPLTSRPSQSYIHPSPSIPTTPSLLSRQNSFFTTTTRSTPATPATVGTHPRKPRRRKYDGGADDDWLVRTASHLTMSRLEEKGVSWLAARESSTSLVDDEPAAAYYSARGSREGSFASVNARGGGGGKKSRRGSSAGSKSEVVPGGMVMSGPDFVDERDEREMRDVLGIADVGFGEEGDEDEDEDGEGMMGVDDREMRRVVMGRIGGWVDWAVGWMDLGDGVAEDLDMEEGGYGEETGGFRAGAEGELDVEEVKRRLGAKAGVEGQEGMEVRDGKVLPPPPAGDQAGILSDARWLLTIACKLAV